VPLALLKYGLQPEYKGERYFPAARPLRDTYDVVIIGGGGHGLACAYYLARDWGITNVAVLEKGWLASGNTARNTAIIRSNYLTPEGALFYEESTRLYRSLANELGINLMYSERGHLTLAHTDAAIRTSRWRAEVNKHLGIDSELVLRDEVVPRTQPVSGCSAPGARCPVPSARRNCAS
jgi:sarcosine oxidase subunit beta